MGRELREVVYVDGVRTAFGRAGKDGYFWRTRADDMAVKVVRELLRRNPQLPPERIDDVVLAATAQVGDQGLTLGRDVALLAGLPKTVPGFAVDRMCAGALTATTAGAGEIAMGAADVVLVGGVEHMGHHPMGDDVDFNPRFVSERIVDESAAVMGQTAENLHDAFPGPDEGSRRRVRGRVAAEGGARLGRRGHGRPGHPDVRLHRRGLDGHRARSVPAARHDPRGLASLRTPFRAGGRVTAGNSAGLTDGATAALLVSEGAAADLELEPRMRLVVVRVRGRRAGAHGPRPRSRDEESARAGRDHDRRRRAVRAQRAVRGAGAHVVRRDGVEPDDPRLNPYGGAIACGHPLAATGVRLMAQLAHGFRERPGRALRADGALHRARHGRGDPLGERRKRWLARPGSSSRRSRRRVGAVALVTMDNGEDWQKPNTFGEAALRSLEELLDRVREAEWAGLLLTGKPFVFAVGADIDEFGEITPERARQGGQAGHELFGRIRELPFPTLAAVNGAALGGGVEIALHCDYRTLSSDVRHFACPEVLLGLIPGWGGTQLIPRLVGAEQAVRFIVENPLRQNRMLNARQAFEAGFADALLEPVEFLDESLAFLVRTIEEGGGEREQVADLSDLDEVVRKARSRIEDQVHGAAPAPYRALDLIAGAGSWSIEEGYRAEEDALAELLPGPQAQASVYSFFLVERRAKRAVGIPETEPRRVSKVGIVGRRPHGEAARAPDPAPAGGPGRAQGPDAGAGRRRDLLDRRRAG